MADMEQMKTPCGVVIDYVMEQLASRKLNIGDKLTPERELAVKLNVSRAAVREALKVLNYLGFVDSTQGSGNYVSGNYDRTVSSIMRVMYLRGDISTEGFTDFRQMLELEAFDLALSNATDRQKAEMMQIINLLEICSDDEFVLALDNRLHSLLIESAGNPFISINFQALSRITENYMANTFYNSIKMRKAGYETLQHYHRTIVESLVAGDREKGRQAIRRHFAWLFP